MRGKLVLASMMLLVALVISVISPNAGALDSEQKSVILTIEQGTTVFFYIYMDGGGAADITHSGQINSWVSHADSVASGDWLEVKVAVPDDAETKSYYENIIADGTTVTKLTVIVTEPVSGRLRAIQNKVEDVIDEQDDLEKYVEDRFDETNAKVTHIEVGLSDMIGSMEQIEELQADVSEAEDRFSADKQMLQQMIQKLESDKTELEQENSQLNAVTGMVSVNWGSAGFALGVIVVVVVLVLYFKVGPRMGSLSAPRIGGRLRGAGRASRASRTKESGIEDKVAEERQHAQQAEFKNKKPAKSRPSHERIRGQAEFKYSYKGR